MKFLSFTVLLLLTAIFTVGGVSAQINTALPDANADANGDGITDWFVTRGVSATNSFENATTPDSFDKFALAKSFRERMKLRKERQQFQTTNQPAAGTPVQWFAQSNVAGGAFSSAQLGTLESDFPTPVDFDGDRKDDIAVWRPGADASAGFFILQSSTGTVRFEQFGVDGDDPTVVGDYDGDHKADLAVYRCPSEAAAQCFFFYQGTLDNPNRAFTSVPFGFGTALENITAAPGDYDGDGKYDFCVYRDAGGNRGQFVLLKSSDKTIEYINWGLFSDTVVPGDFDGDRKADFMVTRAAINGRNIAWYLLTRTGGGTGASPIIWGLIDTDYETPGDYDGDGKTDVAVWRTDTDPDKNFYYVVRSSNQSLLTFEWGQLGDFPVQNWYVR